MNRLRCRWKSIWMSGYFSTTCGLNRMPQPAVAARTSTNWKNRSPGEITLCDTRVQVHLFCCTERNTQFRTNFIPLSNGFSHSPAHNTISMGVYVCICALFSPRRHLFSRFIFILFRYFYFISSHLVSSILKCFSVSHVRSWCASCWLRAYVMFLQRKYRSGKFCTIRIQFLVFLCALALCAHARF